MIVPPIPKTTQLHPEEAKLACTIVMLVGGLLVFMGVLMVSTAHYGTAQEAAMPLVMLWAGIVIFCAGRAIRRTRTLFSNPLLFLGGFMLGTLSVVMVFSGITQGAVGKIGTGVVTQIAALYLVWRASIRRAVADEI